MKEEVDYQTPAFTEGLAGPGVEEEGQDPRKPVEYIQHMSLP